MDVKDLSDLPGYRELIPFGLPRFQYTARIVPEGGAWNRRRAPSAFTRLVEQKYRCRLHRFNPPQLVGARPTAPLTTAT